MARTGVVFGLLAACLLACAVGAVNAQGCGTHTVVAGDTLFNIAQAKNVGLPDLQAANPGVVPEQLSVGQTLQLPCGAGGAKPVTPPVNPAPVNPNPGTGGQPVVPPVPVPSTPGGAGCSHVIAAGDTFFNIAQKKGTTVEAITGLNPGVVPTALQVGQTIKVC